MINFEDKADNARHKEVVGVVARMLDIHKQLAASKTSHDKMTTERQIEAADRAIDQLVYELYGLSKEEIKIVESDESAD